MLSLRTTALARTGLVALGFLGVTAGFFAPQVTFVRRGHGTECAFNVGDLRLIDVTEDGAPVADLSAYEGASVSLWGRAGGEVQITARPKDAPAAFWTETYHVARSNSR